MQNGSITRSKRLKGPDVWEFRWRESGPDGKRKHRRMVVGSIRQFADESAALRTISALRRDINLGKARLRASAQHPGLRTATYRLPSACHKRPAL